MQLAIQSICTQTRKRAPVLIKLVFVEANLTKDFLERIRLHSKQGFSAEIEVSYPWLPPRCAVCHKWGHKDNICIVSSNKQLHNVVKDNIRPVNDVVLLEEQITDTNHSSELQQEELNKDPTTVSETKIGTKENQNSVPETEVLAIDSDIKAADAEGQNESQVEKQEWISVTPSKSTRNGDSRKDLDKEGSSISISPLLFSVLQVDNIEEGEVDNLSREDDTEDGEIEENKSELLDKQGPNKNFATAEQQPIQAVKSGHHSLRQTLQR